MGSNLSANSSTDGRRVVLRPEGAAYGTATAFSSPVVKAGGWVFLSSTSATDADGIVADVAFDPASPYRSDALEAQSYVVYERIKALLAAAGCDIGSEVTRLEHIFRNDHPNPADFAARENWAEGMSVGRHLEARDTYVHPPRPPSVGVAIPELPVAGAEIAVDIVAVEGAQKVGYDVPEGVPAPPSGYSPAVRYGDWVGLAGELATDWQGAFLSERHLGPPTTSAMEARPNPYFWYGLPVEAQAAYVLKKQDLIARSAAASLARCVKATVYVGHPADFYSVERMWKQYFPEDPPARVVVPYVGFGGKGARVEIAMELLADDSDLTPERISTPTAPRPFAHEAQAVRAGDFLFLSTQLPIDSDGRLADAVVPKPALRHYAQPAKLQMEYMLRNIAAICEAAGTSLDNVCRMKLFMDDYAHLAPATEEIAKWFSNDPPALSTYRLGSGPLLVPGAHLLADVVVYAPR